jgi:hypothetical protein
LTVVPRSGSQHGTRNWKKLLIIALNAWDRALRRDECGAWHIQGKFGTIHTYGDGESWILYVACRSTRHWTATKTRLSSCTLNLDGEDEGCFRLHQLPTRVQATIIRDALGIRKRTEFAPDELERRRVSMARFLPAQASTSATSELPCPRAEDTSFLETEPVK